MNLPFFIARRYLFAKKSHNVINIISLISAIGIGIGSLALIVILSVYNGFDTLIKSFYQEYQPHFIITPLEGKSFDLSEDRSETLLNMDGIASLQPVIEEDLFVQYGSRQSIARIKGVDASYGEVSGVSHNIKEGEFNIFVGTTPHAIVGRELASTLRLRPHFLDAIELYYPDRKSVFSILNPAATLNDAILYPSGIIALNQEFDSRCMFVPISIARTLVGYGPTEMTSLEIYLGDEKMSERVERELRGKFEGYVIKNKYQQNETLYKMMRAEKFAVYLILFFVIIIVSVNIFGSLSMLIIDKGKDLQIYASMGAHARMINRIFVLQGWLISLIGSAVGIGTGLLLCVIQKVTGIISLPGNYIVSAYPVDIHLLDVLITFTGVALIGYIIAIIPVRLMK